MITDAVSDLFSIKGVLYDLECLKLQSIAKESKHPIVNIGTYCGKSTAFLASGTKQKVYAIDLWDERPAEFIPSKRDLMRGYHLKKTQDVFLENMEKHGLTNVIPIKGNSKVVGKTWDTPIGVLFIDGDHHYKSALSDYSLFAKHIVVGGWLAIHDYHIKDVRRVIDEIIIPSGLWTGWLATGETIADHTITADTGITVDSSAESDGKVTVWLSGGTAGINYKVACLITTTAGRTDERTIWIKVVER